MRMTTPREVRMRGDDRLPAPQDRADVRPFRAVAIGGRCEVVKANREPWCCQTPHELDAGNGAHRLLQDKRKGRAEGSSLRPGH